MWIWRINFRGRTGWIIGYVIRSGGGQSCFGGIGVLLTNAYVMYVSVNTFIYGFNKNQLMSHHDFKRAIAVAWINLRERRKEIRDREVNIPIIRKRKSTATAVSSLIDESSLHPDEEGKVI